MDGQFDAVIIGSGVVGCSIAFALGKRGLKTLNVDPLPAPGYGSTSHSSAIIRPFYSHIEACALAHEARYRWLEWPHFLGVEDDAGMASYHEGGMTALLFEGEEGAFDAAIASMEEVGVTIQRLSADEVMNLYPDMAGNSFAPVRRSNDEQFGETNGRRLAGAVRVAEAGYVNDPQLAAHNLFAAAKAHGATFLFGEKVAAIERAGQSISSACLASGDKVQVPIVINAAGPHSARVNAMAGILDDMRIRTRPERHEVAYLQLPAAFNGRPENNGPLMDLDSGVYMRPDGSDLLIGSLDPECDPRQIVDPDADNSGFTDQWTCQAWRAALRFPDLKIENTARGTVGIYDVSDDWVPIYDRSELDGFYLAIGTSGNQFKNAPLIGELMAEIINACESGRSHDENPAQLGLPHIGRVISLGYFSRNRTVKGTGNVLA